MVEDAYNPALGRLRQEDWQFMPTWNTQRNSISKNLYIVAIIQTRRRILKCYSVYNNPYLLSLLSLLILFTIGDSFSVKEH
jgi:hypothetical protein